MTSPTQQEETTKGTLFGAYNCVTVIFKMCVISRMMKASLNPSCTELGTTGRRWLLICAMISPRKEAADCY